MNVLLTGGTVLGADGPTQNDVLVEGGVVTEIGSGLSSDDARVIDCTGTWVGPGLPSCPGLYQRISTTRASRRRRSTA